MPIASWVICPTFSSSVMRLSRVFDLLRVVAFRTGATGALKEFVAIEQVGWRLGFDCDQWLEREAQ